LIAKPCIWNSSKENSYEFYKRITTPAATLSSPVPTLANRLVAAEVLVALAKAVLAVRVPPAAMDSTERVGRAPPVVEVRAETAGASVRVDPSGKMVACPEAESVKATPEMVETSAGDAESIVEAADEGDEGVSSEVTGRVDESEEGSAILDELWSRDDEVDVGKSDAPLVVVGDSSDGVVVVIPP
jgi:hypothetical protein